ncbi:hypothetical protein K439DRAFT_1625106 [Ramaria rubella]|nr:hypothetical protein K439DRAFT_1625106 [Ramaria rubella]
MNRYTVHINMACVPDRLMMIKMYAMNRQKLRNYGRDEQKPICKNQTGLALIGWDHLKAFSGDDTKKGDKTVIHKIQEGLVSITGKAFQNDDAKKSDTIVLQGVRCRHPDQITTISLRIVGLGDAPMQPFNSTDTEKHIVVVIAGALEML